MNENHNRRAAEAAVAEAMQREARGGESLALPELRRPALLTTLLATVTGNLYLLFGTLGFSLLAILAAPIPPRGNWTHRVARLWARGLLWASRVRLEVRPASTAATGSAAAARAVLMANHQSLFDIPALLAAIPGQVRFVAKRSLFRIPVFGWALTLGGFVPVDRENRSTARASFAAALDKLARGASIAVFPEEVRSLGGRVLPFRRGGFLMAWKTGLPIVPVGLHGTYDVQTRRSFLIRPQTVTVRFGEPVSLAGRSVRELPAVSEEIRRQVAVLAGTTCADVDLAS